jgi:hypothetical protein
MVFIVFIVLYCYLYLFNVYSVWYKFGIKCCYAFELQATLVWKHGLRAAIVDPFVFSLLPYFGGRKRQALVTATVASLKQVITTSTGLNSFWSSSTYTGDPATSGSYTQLPKDCLWLSLVKYCTNQGSHVPVLASEAKSKEHAGVKSALPKSMCRTRHRTRGVLTWTHHHITWHDSRCSKNT